MSLDLDAAQLAVAEAPADARRLVIAGAGQGKTEVVAARLRYLAEEEMLSSSTELMVLSFSRAAVHAVRSRIEGHEMAECNVRTFDSFASYVLIENDQEPFGDFDSRIRQATRLIRDHEGELEGVGGIRHVILDEVQDLVGDRAEMVLELLKRLHREDSEVGFTALGDPLQGIYDFTLESSQSKCRSEEFFAALTGDLNAGLVALEKSYRATGDFPRRVVGIGDQLREESTGDRADSVLGAFTDTLPHSGVVRNWSFLGAGEGTTAVLCQTNGEVLHVSRLLAKAGVRHVVRRPARSYGAAAWLTDVLQDLPGPSVGRSDVESAVEHRLEGDLRENAWYLLKGAAGTSRSMHQLDLGRLRNRIRSGAVPLTLTQPDTANVVVSTVHRAKGLEFDRVFFVHRGYEPEGTDPWDSVHLRYVAMSRAREDISVIDLPSRYSWFDDRRANRQRERKNSKQGTQYTAAVEMIGDDVEDRRPLHMDAAGADVANALRSLEPGSEVDAVFERLSDDMEVPIFALRTPSGEGIGVTKPTFGQLLAAEFGYRYPAGWDGVAVRGIRLAAVETVACDPQFTEAAGMGRSGLWLVPRLTGLVVPE